MIKALDYQSLPNKYLSLKEMYPAYYNVLSATQKKAHDEGFATLTNRLAKVDPTVYEPIIFTTYRKDFAAIEASNELVDNIEYYATDYKGLVDDINNIVATRNDVVPRVSAGLNQAKVPVFLFQLTYVLKFAELEKLGYEREATVKGSSGGGYVDKESGIEIIHKNITGIGSAGLDNEDIFVNSINEAVPINVKIIPSSGPTLNYPNIVQASGVGKEGESKGWKADAHLKDSSGKIYPVSIKKDGSFRWSSAMRTHGDIFNLILQKADRGEISGLELKVDQENPRVLNMVNPENDKNYGRVFIKNAPRLDIDSLAFGPDNADVVQRSFTTNDFKVEGDTLNITSTKNYKEVDDFKEEDYPILQLERNASKATQTQGLTGRGITIRTVPASAMSTGARANNLIIDYNEIS